MRVLPSENDRELVVSFTRDDATALIPALQWLVDELNEEDREFIDQLPVLFEATRQEAIAKLSDLYIFLTDTADYTHGDD